VGRGFLELYKDVTIKKYLEDLAAKSATPGGGSAAALTAAMAAALVSMVVNFTLGKAKYQSFDKELRQALLKSEKLRQEFLRLLDLDIVAYNSKNMRDALNIPFMVARLSLEGIKLCPGLVKKSNLNLISDVAVAAVFFESAFTAAYFNVEINLKVINDKKLALMIRKELEQKAKTISKIRRLVEAKVDKIIRG
jgi:formiminotetrahydrofolate cyclodeaminase